MVALSEVDREIEMMASTSWREMSGSAMLAGEEGGCVDCGDVGDDSLFSQKERVHWGQLFRMGLCSQD